MAVLDNSVSKLRVAAAFSRVLRDWLTVDEFAELVELNREETDKTVCHSHDFCDANMAMHEALVECGAIDKDGFDADDEFIVELFSAAWDEAVKNEFYLHEES
jgi:hypothetical protein